MSTHTTSEVLEDFQKQEIPHHNKSEVPVVTTAGAALDAEDLGAPEMHFKTYIVVIAASISFLTYVWGLVAFGLNQRALAAAVGSPQNYVFIQNATNLVSLVVAPPMGKISDNVGRKWLVLFGVCGGGFGLCLSGGATTIGMAIAGAAIFGLSSGSVYIMSAIVSEIVPRRYRGPVQGVFNFFAAAGGLFGSIAGQALSATTSIGGRPGYQFALYVPGIITFAGAIMILFAYNPPPTPNPENRPFVTRLLDFDKVGSLLLTACITPLTVGLSWGGSIFPWGAPRVIATLVVGCMFLVAFAIHQTVFKKDGLFHHDMFRRRNTALACCVVFAQGVFYFTYNGFFGNQLNILFESRPVMFGFRFSIFFMPQLVLYPLVGWYTGRFKDIKWPLVFSFLMFALVMVVQSQAKATSVWDKVFYVTPILGGLAYPAPEVVLFVIGQLDVPPHLVGTVSALLGSVRALGGVIGVSVGSTIFTSKLTSAFTTKLPAALVGAGAPAASVPALISALTAGNTAALATIEGATPAVLAAGGAAVVDSYVYAFPYLWYFVLPFTIVAFILCLFLQDMSKEMTWIINRPVEEIHYKEKHSNHVEGGNAPH